MPIHLITEKSDGEIIKGLQDCSIPSPTTKELVDTDLNHGTVNPGGTTVPEIIRFKTFSWSANGDPSNSITDCGLFLTEYYTVDPTYSPDAGKTYCGGASSATFGDYGDSNGSHSSSADLAALQAWGDAGTGGVEVSVDKGLSYTKFTSSVGILSSPITLASTAFDIGSVDGQLNPGDKATIHVRIAVPSTYTDPANQGVWLFNIGVFFSYTE